MEEIIEEYGEALAYLVVGLIIGGFFAVVLSVFVLC